jgi:uncharacterized protein (DUF3084 family)
VELTQEIADLKLELTNTKSEVQEFKVKLSEKDTVIAEKDNTITEKDELLAEKDTELARLQADLDTNKALVDDYREKEQERLDKIKGDLQTEIDNFIKEKELELEYNYDELEIVDLERIFKTLQGASVSKGQGVASDGTDPVAGKKEELRKLMYGYKRNEKGERVL